MISHDVLKDISECDLLLPVLHGPYGEDGTIQGFFEMMGKAYVGCDFRSAAIAMDKALTKRLVMESGLPALPFVSVTAHQWRTGREEFVSRILSELVFPVFVKPVHLGSTVGVHKVNEAGALEGAIDNALKFDTKIIVENGVLSPREIEFAVLGNDSPVTFPPGEILADGGMYDYESKYGMNPAVAAIGSDAVAKLPADKVKEGMELALKSYQAIGCTGMARVDTFLDSNGKFWLNEINPIPGFTRYSLYPMMCEANGLGLPALLDRLAILGLERHRLHARVAKSLTG